MQRKGNPAHCWWACRLVQPLWKTAMNVLKKLNTEFDPVILLLGLYPKNPQSPVQKNLSAPVFIAMLFTIAKCWKQTKCPSANEWIKILWYIYVVGYFAAERRKELLSFVTPWMELNNIMLS